MLTLCLGTLHERLLLKVGASYDDKFDCGVHVLFCVYL